jgi:hypothetical protein
MLCREASVAVWGRARELVAVAPYAPLEQALNRLWRETAPTRFELGSHQPSSEKVKILDEDVQTLNLEFTNQPTKKRIFPTEYKGNPN